MIERLWAELRAGRSVPWCKGLALTPDGVGLADGTVVPYPELGWAWFYDGNHLMVRRADIGRTVAILPAAMPNLLPGLAVLERLCQRAKTMPVG